MYCFLYKFAHARMEEGVISCMYIFILWNPKGRPTHDQPVREERVLLSNSAFETLERNVQFIRWFWHTGEDK